ncbi:hypothetical protein [Pseudooceanicola nitratireducens]|uniref:hypothetical protein n=1 Tax=Pseudooceanicola nitratireducens TaxID=517719 RepID=UPI001C93FB23|nr:hypothetical protein [Pseudooceanicola nitratireducens]MBY6167223.1 hypothetical protein [Pseudooceanicola nitratireducens]
MMEGISEAISALGQFLMAGAAIAGAVAAFMGLDRWKNQTVWQGDRDLARKLLVSLYLRKNAVKAVRNPFGFEGEGGPIAADTPEDEKNWKATLKKYQFRLGKLEEVKSEIFALEAEAKAIWGNEIEEFSRQVWNREHELAVEIYEYINAQHPRYRGSDYFEDKEARKSNSLQVFGGSSQDPFWPKYDAACINLETYLRTKLGRKQ